MNNLENTRYQQTIYTHTNEISTNNLHKHKLDINKQSTYTHELDINKQSTHTHPHSLDSCVLSKIECKGHCQTLFTKVDTGIAE